MEIIQEEKLSLEKKIKYINTIVIFTKKAGQIIRPSEHKRKNFIFCHEHIILRVLFFFFIYTNEMSSFQSSPSLLYCQVY
jgi:hypothetical protein